MDFLLVTDNQQGLSGTGCISDVVTRHRNEGGTRRG